jgi:hypothetical protein
VRFTYIYDVENDNEGIERTVTDYEAPDKSRDVAEDGVTITVGLDAYHGATLAGPFNHEVLRHGVNALNFLDELGSPSADDVTRKGDVYEFKTEKTTTASVTVKEGYVRVVQLIGKSEGYPATTSTWLLTNIDAAGIQITAPTNVVP